MNTTPAPTDTVAVDMGAICYPYRGRTVLAEVVDVLEPTKEKRRRPIVVEIEHRGGERRTYTVPLAVVRRP